MAEFHFTADAIWNVGFDAASDKGYRTLAYKSADNDGAELGGGTLQVLVLGDNTTGNVPLPDAKLSASVVDDNGDVVQLFTFSAAGNISVELSGSTDPDCWVSVL
jgi:hypothetical protein